MNSSKIEDLSHSHSFGQEEKRPGEARTIIVIAISGVMMIVEVATGLLYGSMALLADGLHMASHSVALTINAFAYIYARKHAHDGTFSFGTGKVNALGGFAGSILLAFFALVMVWESVDRFIHPVDIEFNQAILVAVLGLIVNGASMLILGHRESHKHHEDHDHGAQQRRQEDIHHHDHNLRSAYLHVLADALTSFLAIFALLAAKYAGLVWLDPLMGVVGAVLVSRWSLGLMRSTSAVLLDKQAPRGVLSRVVQSIEQEPGNRVTDLHLWGIGPGIYCAVITIVVSGRPGSPEHYKGMIPDNLGLVHTTVEVHKGPPTSDIFRVPD